MDIIVINLREGSLPKLLQCDQSIFRLLFSFSLDLLKLVFPHHVQAFLYMNILHSFLLRSTKPIWKTTNECMCVRNLTFFFISRKWCLTRFPFFQHQYLEAPMDDLLCVRNKFLGFYRLRILYHVCQLHVVICMSRV